MTIDVRAAQAEALFCSMVQPSDRPGPVQVDESIAAMARKYGTRNCRNIVAQEYGEHPEAAAQRMAWARYMVAVTYPPRHRHTKPYPWCQRCWYTPERVAAIRAQVRQAKAAARDEPPSPPMTAAQVIAELERRVRS